MSLKKIFTYLTLMFGIASGADNLPNELDQLTITTSPETPTAPQRKSILKKNTNQTTQNKQLTWKLKDQEADELAIEVATFERYNVETWEDEPNEFILATAYTKHGTEAPWAVIYEEICTLDIYYHWCASKLKYNNIENVDEDVYRMMTRHSSAFYSTVAIFMASNIKFDIDAFEKDFSGLMTQELRTIYFEEKHKDDEDGSTQLTASRLYN